MCCGEGGTLQTNIVVYVESACSVWTTLGFLQLTVTCAFQVYTAQAPGCSAGYCPKWALHFVHFPGLSHSGSGSQVLCKGTDSDGCAFCAFPRSEQVRQPSAWRAYCPRWAVHLNHLPSINHLVSWVHHESTRCALCLSGELISGCNPPGRCKPSRILGRCS